VGSEGAEVAEDLADSAADPSGAGVVAGVGSGHG
jgi:hypothetical protein